MITRIIDRNALDDICLIHKLSFDPSHFTSVFSTNLLKKYYNAIITGCEYKVIVYENETGDPIGYAIGSKNISGFLKPFIKQNILWLIIVMLRNPRFLLEKIMSIFNSAFKAESFKSKAEVMLYIITINPENKIKGKGQIVLDEFEKVLKQDSVKRYSLGVRKDNIKAINFYERNGFIPEHSTRESYEYIKTLL